MGPLIFTRLLDLNDTQAGVLGLVFKIADDNGLLILDYEDLLALISWVSEEKANLRDEYGALSESTLGTIRRKLLEFGGRGGEALFGEPALNLADLMRRTIDGRGMISVMDARSVVADSRAYTSFLLWLLSELFEDLDEVGDLAAPRLVFFFDEAHLLFQDAPGALVERIETVVRLVRSKGMGVYFITQNPLDIPERVLGQLGNRFQHALRAFTPKDQKAVRVAAQTFRPNPALDTEQVITELGVGEALVSCLDAAGTPSIVERVLIAPPVSRLGPLTDAERQSIIANSPVRGLYDNRVNRESARELLERRKNTLRVQVEPPASKSARAEKAPAEKPSIFVKSAESAAQSFLRSFGTQVGRAVFRGVLGSMSRR
jgi:DNA helicase HerA-like ATPase